MLTTIILLMVNIYGSWDIQLYSLTESWKIELILSQSVKNSFQIFRKAKE